MDENLNYSAAVLMKNFKKSFNGPYIKLGTFVQSVFDIGKAVE